MSLFWNCLYGCIDSPTGFYARASRRVFDDASSRFHGIDQRHASSAVNHHMVVPRVPHLLSLRRPVAIVRFIISVVVSAFYRHARARLWAHISNEIDEFPPLVAHRDAPTPVVLEIWRGFVGAALDHLGPRSMFRRMALPVQKPRVGKHLIPEAPARLCVAAAQARAHACFHGAAVASTNPPSLTRSCIRRPVDNKPSTKPFPNHFLNLRHYASSSWFPGTPFMEDSHALYE